MASSEIEIVSDANDQKNSAQNPTEVPIIDVFGASAYGDFEKLRKFVEDDGVSLSKPDGNGYYALQWAALNNFAAIVQYIVEVGASIGSRLIFFFFLRFVEFVIVEAWWRCSCHRQREADRAALGSGAGFNYRG